MVEVLPKIKQIPILIKSNLYKQIIYAKSLTMAAMINPAARMKTVCENCWRYQPRIKPTTPNMTIMVCDINSALPCPS